MNLSGEPKTKMNYSAISEGVEILTMTASEKSFYTVLEQKTANISKADIYSTRKNARGVN